MLKSYCLNCSGAKTTEYLSRPYCSDCTEVKTAAETYAREQTLDVGMVVREALGAKTRRSMDGRDPRMPFDRVSQDEMSRRSEITPGSIEDPRRARLPI